MNFLSTISSAISSKTPQLLFTIGEKDPIQPENSIWRLYNGIKKDDKQQVSVFIFDKKHNPSALELARNNLKRSKTIRFPDCLKYIDGTETDTQIIIGTEYVRPLELSKDHMEENSIRLGLYRLAVTLKFLSLDCKLIHGNVNENSIYVTKAGEWKLGGMELTSAVNDNHLKNYGSLVGNRYIPPESDPSNDVNQYPVHSYDSWAFGCLIQSLFNGKQAIAQNTKASIPTLLYQASKGFLSTTPGARTDFTRFLAVCTRKGGYFDNPMIETSLFFENFALKEKEEKEAFLLDIDKSMDKFPLEFCKYKILPELLHALEYSGGGTKTLIPVLTMAARLSKEEFQLLVIPSIIKLFSSTDRAIRLALCQKIDSYVDHLPPKIANDVIYPNLVLYNLSSNLVFKTLFQ
jgi:SCY1-like protein 1